MGGALQMPRMCGSSRIEGGIYLENGGGDAALEEFLLCPGRMIPDNLVLPNRGVRLFHDAEGQIHVGDMIGESSYPFPVIWLEETRVGGVSRHINKQVASQLTPGSLVFVAHKKAYTLQFNQYPHFFHCPIHKSEHQEQQNIEQCISYYWEDFEDMSGFTSRMEDDEDIQFPAHCMQHRESLPDYMRYRKKVCHFRHPAGFSFYGFFRRTQQKPVYWKNGAFFAAFPISRVVVVSARNGSHTDVLHELQDTIEIPVEEVEK